MDSDNDGIVDAVEGNGGILPADMTGNGQYPLLILQNYDWDKNGMANAVDIAITGSHPLSLPDSDLDGSNDFLDTYSDFDNQPDWIEAFDDNKNGNALDDLNVRALIWENANGNPGIFTQAGASTGVLPNWLKDDDGDGWPNFLDPTATAFYRVQSTSGFSRNGLVNLFNVLQGGKIASVPDVNNDRIPDYRQISAIIILPIELLNFTAQAETEGVLLKWATASERNNAYFEIQRSLDGIRYESIGQLTGAGTTVEQQHYQYLDATVEAGTYYYRLQQVDEDGTTTHSNPIWVQWNTTQPWELQVYPNPLKGQQLYFSLGKNFAGTLAYKIINLQGQVLLQGTSSSANLGEGQLPVPASLPNGLYLLEINLPQQTLMERFHLLR